MARTRISPKCRMTRFTRNKGYFEGRTLDLRWWGGGGDTSCHEFVLSISVPNAKLDLLSAGHKALFFFCLPLSTVHCKAQ